MNTTEKQAQLILAAINAPPEMPNPPLIDGICPVCKAKGATDAGGAERCPNGHFGHGISVGPLSETIPPIDPNRPSEWKNWNGGVFTAATKGG